MRSLGVLVLALAVMSVVLGVVTLSVLVPVVDVVRLARVVGEVSVALGAVVQGVSPGAKRFASVGLLAGCCNLGLL